MSIQWGIKPDNAQPRESMATAAIVNLSMVCGFNRITEKNAAEVYARCAVWERLYGAVWHTSVDPSVDSSGLKPRPITPDDIRAHIGFFTNASAITRLAFTRRVSERALRGEEDVYTGHLEPGPHRASVA